MPPALTDDEESDHGETSFSAPKPKAPLVDEDEPMGENGAANGGADEEDEEDEELEPDEFVVESILGHKLDLKTGELRYHVKWEGYPDPQDRTWEPEENLAETASEILEQYFEKNGGRDAVLEESNRAAKSKKRGRQSDGRSNPSGSKRSRYDENSAVPAGSQQWKPPPGSWEETISTLDAMMDENTGDLVFYATWKNGQKTKHDKSVIYMKCPQKVIRFYERHVKFVPSTNPE